MYLIGTDFLQAMDKIKELEQAASTDDVKQLAAATRKALRSIEQKLKHEYDEKEAQKRR